MIAFNNAVQEYTQTTCSTNEEPIYFSKLNVSSFNGSTGAKKGPSLTEASFSKDECSDMYAVGMEACHDVLANSMAGTFAQAAASALFNPLVGAGWLLFNSIRHDMAHLSCKQSVVKSWKVCRNYH
jgi:hypothetical protein